MRLLSATDKLREPLQELIDNASRINSNKPQRYWYPLSMATYYVEEVMAAVDSLCSFRTTMWEKTRQFEQRFADSQGAMQATMVNSGSSADLLIAFALVNPMANLLAPGDEILIPSVTWPTQVWSAMMAGLRVRIVDTDPATLNMDLQDLESKISRNTRAISLVHLMGNPCDMDSIGRISAKHDLLVVEDCCESLGAKWDGKAVGNFGVASAFSFFFSHHITTMEGGMILSQDEAVSDLFRLLRAHGWSRNTQYLDSPVPDGLDPRYMFLNWGFNVRPTELQAGFGLIQLERLPGFHATRLANAEYFASLLKPYEEVLRLMQIHPKAECSWFALPLMVGADAPFDRNELVTFLESQGIETRPIVGGSLARHPVADMFPELKEVDLPGADQVHERGFYLGLYPLESRAKLDRLAETIIGFLKKLH